MTPPFRGWLTAALSVTTALGSVRAARAQVALSPVTVTPAAWERFALRVINQADTPTVAVRLVVPEVVQILGVEAVPIWTVRRWAATDSTPQTIEWSGGRVERGRFVELAFLGRVAPDARPGQDLVFPVHLTRADGTTRDWMRGGEGAPLVVSITGTVRASASGAFALAAAALGVATLALGLTLARWGDGGRRRGTERDGEER